MLPIPQAVFRSPNRGPILESLPRSRSYEGDGVIRTLLRWRSSGVLWCPWDRIPRAGILERPAAWWDVSSVLELCPGSFLLEICHLECIRKGKLHPTDHACLLWIHLCFAIGLLHFPPHTPSQRSKKVLSLQPSIKRVLPPSQLPLVDNQ